MWVLLSVKNVLKQLPLAFLFILNYHILCESVAFVSPRIINVSLVGGGMATSVVDVLV